MRHFNPQPLWYPPNGHKHAEKICLVPIYLTTINLCHESFRAVEMGLCVVCAFVRLSEVLASNKELARQLDNRKRKTEALALPHDIFAQNTRV